MKPRTARWIAVWLALLAFFLGGAAIALYHPNPPQTWYLLPYASGSSGFGAFVAMMTGAEL